MRRSGIDVTRLIRATEDMRAGVGTTYLSASAASSLFGIALLVVAGGWLAVAIFVGPLGLSIPFYIRAGQAAERSRHDVAESVAEFASVQMQTLEAMIDMRSLNAVSFASTRVGVASRATARTVIESIRIAMGSSLVTEFIGGAAIGLVAMVVGFDLMNGRRTLATGVIALWIVVDINAKVRQWAGAFHQREDALIGQRFLASKEPIETHRTNDGHLITANEVTFGNWVSPVSLTVMPGDRILVTGASGSGKTSLLRTLVGIDQPPFGHVAVTEQPIGWVQASSQLVPATLRRNLDLHGTVSDEAIRIVLHQLGLGQDRFADLEMVITSADQFSDGERARLAIARALLSEAPLMVIDDVAGLFDGPILSLVAETLRRRPHLAIVEAAHDRRILSDASIVVTLEAS
jgi:ABC-type transport system involved in cytochrome bd biosynthesis fused ATPase/permease subunit